MNTIGLDNVLTITAVVFLGFLLFREIVTWYWKINRIVSLLEQIEKNTRKDAPAASEKAPETPVRNGPFS